MMTSSRSSASPTGQAEGGPTRRGFLAGAVAIAGFPYIVPGHVLGKNGRAAASERITVGVIGTGGPGHR